MIYIYDISIYINITYIWKLDECKTLKEEEEKQHRLQLQMVQEKDEKEEEEGRLGRRRV